jgi:hypothetical protein
MRLFADPVTTGKARRGFPALIYYFRSCPLTPPIWPKSRSAKEQFPDDPHISDTLGWIYYKKNVFSRAIVYLREANDKIQNNPI